MEALDDYVPLRHVEMHDEEDQQVIRELVYYWYAKG